MSLSKDISYIHSPQTTEYLYKTIPEQLATYADKIPDKEAVVFIDRSGTRNSISCRHLYEQAVLFAKGLIQLGIRKGDTVATSLPNCKEWLISTFGIQMVGAIPLHFLFYKSDGSDILQILSQTGSCAAILIDPGENDINWNICNQFFDNLQPCGAVNSNIIPSLRYLITLSQPTISNVKHGLLIENVLEIGQENIKIDLPIVDPDGVAAIMLTSGSTGAPKLVQYSHFTMLNFGYHLCFSLDLSPDDKYYNDRVFSWVVGYPTCFLYQGTTRVTVPKILQFESIQGIIENTVQVIERESCNVALMMGSCIYEMLHSSIPPCKQWPLKTVATAGFPIPASYSDVINKIARKFVVSYGTTEAGCIACLQVTESQIFPDYTVGKPVPGVEVKIIDDQKNIVPLNTSGEIYARHSVRPLGYTDTAKNNAVFSPSGWFRTDDIGYMMEGGIFATTGRKSDVLLCSGLLVSPAYIETEIQEHPGVKAVVVIPIRNEKSFQDICACVIAKPGVVLTVESLEQHYQGKYIVLPVFRSSRPKYYLFFDDFPKTPSGKISRHEVMLEAKRRLEIQ